MRLSAKEENLKSNRIAPVVCCFLVLAGPLGAGCGSSSSSSSGGPVPTTTSPSTTQVPTQSGESGSAEAPSEAESAATGDIPDNQVFLVYRDPAAGYSIRYPEGWARKGAGSNLTFREKANVIHLTIRKGAARGKPGEKVTFTSLSAPDPVTGKRLKIMVDRYEYPHGGKLAVLDLATPEGVDNVDAYRLISESFKWKP
jgi:hypothetical protein